MTTYNRLAARKITGAIAHLLTGKHNPIPADILRRLIACHLRELYDILPPKFNGIILRMERENDAGDCAGLEFAAGLDLLTAMLPVTYGMIPAGSTFQIYEHMPTTFRKRKNGVEVDGRLYPHFPANTCVIA